MTRIKIGRAVAAPRALLARRGILRSIIHRSPPAALEADATGVAISGGEFDHIFISAAEAKRLKSRNV
jgi:hypothetical protein